MGFASMDFRFASGLMGLVQVLCIVGLFHSEYGTFNLAAYEIYLGVALMMLIGFGYLMTFLKQYGLGAVGFTFIITCLTVQINVLLAACIPNYRTPVIDASSLMDGNFAAATVLISYGCIIGKASPSQLVAMSILESVVFQVNRNILCVNAFNVEDAGGTIVIHLFGAYFGLAIAWILGAPNDPSGAESSSMTSDVTSLIGTLVLWVYWPSFNTGGYAVASSVDAGRAVANTVAGLLASCTITFIASGMIAGRLQPVDIQNATLAGGVAVGVIARMNIGLGWASIIGGVGGAIATLGFNYVQPFLQSKIGLHDSCGVNNLHGMPALFGGLSSIILVEMKRDPGLVNAKGEAGGYQAAALFATLGVSIVSGLLTGVALKYMRLAIKIVAEHHEGSFTGATSQERSVRRRSIHFADGQYWKTDDIGLGDGPQSRRPSSAEIVSSAEGAEVVKSQRKPGSGCNRGSVDFTDDTYWKTAPPKPKALPKAVGAASGQSLEQGSPAKCQRQDTSPGVSRGSVDFTDDSYWKTSTPQPPASKKDDVVKV